MDRRSFIADTARALAGIGLAGLVGSLVGRNRAGETCINQGVCRGCRRVADCHLPQALSARQAGSSVAESSKE